MLAIDGFYQHQKEEGEEENAMPFHQRQKEEEEENAMPMIDIP